MSSGRQQHSTLALTSLVEVTPGLEESIRTAAKARVEAQRAKRDAERIYLCQNVNLATRTDREDHDGPLPLMLGQTVNMEGKFCLYCGHPVVLRASVEKSGGME
jgi:hypothetical protein